jgi:acid phosphatase class B
MQFVKEIIFRKAQFYKGKEKRKDKSNLILEAGTHWDKLNSTWTSRTVLAYPGKLKPKTAMGKAQREVNLNRVLGRYSELVEPSYSNKMIVNFDSKCSGTYL